MHPIICNIGPLTVYSYGLMLVLAFALGTFLAVIEAKKEKIDPEIIFNFTFTGFVFGILGSRLFYVIENLGFYIREPLEIIMLQRGGLSWFGGLMLGAFSGIMYLKNKKQDVYKILDLIAPFIALAQAIGRIGCLLNGCCYGKSSPSGIYFSNQEAFLIPTQAYSSLLLIIIFIALRFFQDRPHKLGQIFFIYLLLYSVKRFFIEFWRADNPVIFAGLTLFQILSIVIFCISLVKLFLISRSKN